MVANILPVLAAGRFLPSARGFNFTVTCVRGGWAGETDVRTFEATYRNRDAVRMYVQSDN